MTFGFSRDDADKFLGAYYDKKFYENDPFAKLDQVGVGKLVKMAATMGHESNPDIHLGICGDTAASCFRRVLPQGRSGLRFYSPFRVPIARLAAAQAAVSRRCNSLPRQHKTHNSEPPVNDRRLVFTERMVG